jgi:phosphopantothenate synthetase
MDERKHLSQVAFVAEVRKAICSHVVSDLQNRKTSARTRGFAEIFIQESTLDILGEQRVGSRISYLCEMRIRQSREGIEAADDAISSIFQVLKPLHENRDTSWTLRFNFECDAAELS